MRSVPLALAACTQAEVNAVFDSAKAAQKAWAKTPLWKRAELLHKAAKILRDNKDPIAESLVYEIAKPKKDAVTEVSWALKKTLIGTSCEALSG